MIGFIRGIKLLRTSDIPFLNPSELSDSPKRYTDGYDSRNISFKERGDICSPHNPSPDLPVAKGSASITVPTIRGSEDSSTQGLSDHCSSGSNGIGLSAGVRLQKKEEQQPMFDPKVIDMDASAIMRYAMALMLALNIAVLLSSALT